MTHDDDPGRPLDDHVVREELPVWGAEPQAATQPAPAVRVPIAQAPTAPLPIGPSIARGFEAWIDCIGPLTIIGLLATAIVVVAGALAWPLVAHLPPTDQWSVDGDFTLSGSEVGRLLGWVAIVGFVAFLASGVQRAASTLVVAHHVEPDRDYDGRMGPALRTGLRDLPKIIATELIVLLTGMYGAFLLARWLLLAGAGASAGGGAAGAAAFSFLATFALALVIGVVLAPAIPAIVLERRRLLDGIERGFRLAFGYFFRLAAVLVVAAVVASVGAWIVGKLLGNLLSDGLAADLIAQGLAYVAFGSLWIALTAVAFLAMTGVTDPGE